MSSGMAVKPVTKRVVIPAAGTITLATVLGRDPKTWMGSLAIRAARANANDVFWRDEGGESGGYIGPGEAVSMDFGSGQALIQNFTLVGAASDVVFITVGLNRHYFTSEQ